MGNILPILISYNLHKAYLEEQLDNINIKEQKVQLLKEQKRFVKKKKKYTNNI